LTQNNHQAWNVLFDPYSIINIGKKYVVMIVRESESLLNTKTKYVIITLGIKWTMWVVLCLLTVQNTYIVQVSRVGACTQYHVT